MKTKLLLLILVVLIANIAWAEEDWDNAIKITWEKLYNDQALRVIYGGELEFLQRKEPLNELYLSILDQKQLRILRNTIFAQYGQIFNSEDLNLHFARFSWYKPVTNNVKQFLTETDKQNLNRILLFENGYSSKNLFENKDLVGFWQREMIGAAAGWDESILFYPNNKYTYHYSQMEELKRILSFSGTYRLIGNRLELTVTKQKILADAKVKENVDYWGRFYIDEYKVQDETVYPPVVMNFPISEIKDYVIEADVSFQYIEIGGVRYFFMKKDPDFY